MHGGYLRTISSILNSCHGNFSCSAHYHATFLHGIRKTVNLNYLDLDLILGVPLPFHRPSYLTPELLKHDFWVSQGSVNGSWLIPFHVETRMHGKEKL